MANQHEHQQQRTTADTSAGRKPPQISAFDGRGSIWTLPFFLLVCVQFSFGTSFSTFFALPKYLLQELSASPSLLGNAHGAFALGGVAAIFVVGPLLDRYGRLPVLFAGLGLGMLSYAPFGYVHSVGGILLLRVLHGVAFSAVFNAGAALTVDMAPPTRRAEALGYFATAMLVTNALGPTLAELIADAWNWQAVFWSCSLCAFVGLMAASGLNRVSPRSAKISVTSVTSPKGVVSLALIGAYVGGAAMGVGTGTSKTFLPALLVDSALPLAPYFLAYTAGAFVQRTVFGWVPDRFGGTWAWRDRRLVRLPGSMLAMGCYSVALFLPSQVDALDHIYWLAPLVGMAHGMAYPALSALAVDLGGPQVRGRVTAWLTGAFNLGFAASTAGLAPLEPWLGYTGLLECGAAFLLLSALIVPALILVDLRSQRVPRNSAATSARVV